MALSNSYLLCLIFCAFAITPSLASISRLLLPFSSRIDVNETIPEKLESMQFLAAPDLVSHRNLQSLINVSFAQLSCNDPMQSPCDTYSAVGASYTSNGRLTIPCGKCVTMDITDNSTLTFSGGMRIIGKLNFPNEAIVIIRTTSLIVEGELSMTSTDAITGSPKVKFIMTGTAAVTFTPSAPNSMVCGTSGCNIGPKAVVIAGGKLNIRGISDSCPTVAYMEDMDMSEVNTFPAVSFDLKKMRNRS
jgi:hypothetical protein